MPDGKLRIRLRRASGIRTANGGYQRNSNRKDEEVMLQVMLGDFNLKKTVYKLRKIIDSQILLNLQHDHLEAQN